MTETEARETLERLILPQNAPLRRKIERAIQTAKQIGSSWPTEHVNLIHIDYTNDHDFWRMVIE